MRNNKIKLPPPIHLTGEDVRWTEIVRRSVDGLAAIAESNAEGCDVSWMAMEYGLESVRELLDQILKDYNERIEEGLKGVRNE